MAQRLDQLAQALFNQPTLKESSVEQLQDLTNRYPYFSAAQYLLLKKQHSFQNQNAEALHVAALHTYHPFQLQQIVAEMDLADITDLNAEQKTIIFSEGKAAEFSKPIITDPIITEEENDIAEEDQLPVDEQMPIAPLVIPQPASSTHSEITFEPFHTVDYFASQGIKLSQKEIGNDSFSKQLRSFTEWLKTMKKIAAEDPSTPSDAKGESKVAHLAAYSLQKPDVLTEAMAEVWVKQGNMEKAAEVYNKLSLLNPSKKAYFASKIESLKKSN